MERDETPDEMERRFIREADEAEQDGTNDPNLERNRVARETSRELTRNAHDIVDRMKRARERGYPAGSN